MSNNPLDYLDGSYNALRNPLRFPLLVVMCCLAMGCRYGVNWGAPGTVGQQRARAQVHDPFPSSDLGPPIVSGRPQGFERPTSEVNRLQRDNPFARRNQAIMPYPSDPTPVFPGMAAPPFQPSYPANQPPQ